MESACAIFRASQVTRSSSAGSAGSAISGALDQEVSENLRRLRGITSFSPAFRVGLERPPDTVSSDGSVNFLIARWEPYPLTPPVRDEVARAF